MGMVYHLLFLFQSCRLLNPILIIQKFGSITESFIHQFLVSFLVSYSPFLVSYSPFLESSFAFWVSLWLSFLGVILNFLSTFYVSCPLFCLLYWVSVHFSVHHLHNLAYLFIVLEFTLGFILGSLKLLGFILSYCHSIRWKMENVKISPCFRWDYVKI